MKLLKSYTHNKVSDIENKNIFKRTTARGIIIRDEEILLIYTKRYNDYSFPGGGVDSNEDLREGLLR
ncbi:MAG: NUDIX domain-containing protein, partial [Proteocatella sp.]